MMPLLFDSSDSFRGPHKIVMLDARPASFMSGCGYMSRT
jgi:hypothetical protein